MSEAALVEKSMDSVSVHKERLKRRSLIEESRRAELEKGCQKEDLDVQNRIDSVALAQRRMQDSQRPPSKDHGRRKPRTRFFTEPPSQVLEDSAKDANKRKKSLGRRFTDALSFSKRSSDGSANGDAQPTDVESSPPSLHIQFQDKVETIPTEPVHIESSSEDDERA